MCCENSGFCGSIIRILLTIINVTFFAVGAVVFIIAGILQWDSGSIINKINDEIGTIIDITAFSDLSIVLLILGGAIMLVAVVGLIGACCANRFFLVVYEIVLILLFIAHIIVVIIVVIEAPAIEKEFKKKLNESVTDVINAPPSQYKEKCKALRGISVTFDCCGYNGAADYPLAARIECCEKLTDPGCADKVISTFKDDAVNLLVIPNAVVLALELIFIIAVPFLIGRIAKSKKKESYTPTYGNQNVHFR